MTPLKSEPTVALTDTLLLKPEPPYRLTLGKAPDLKSLFLTEAASRSWARFSADGDEPTGALYWISGPPGCGKTHFLSYLLALEASGGSELASRGRRIVVPINIVRPAQAESLDTVLFEHLAQTLGVSPRTRTLWSELGEEEALRVALGDAARGGVASVTVGVDFGEVDPAPSFGALERLGRQARVLRRPRLTVVAAGRGAAPAEARMLEVEPQDLLERFAAALARVREIRPGWETRLSILYSKSGSEDRLMRHLFPFSPQSIEVLRLLLEDSTNVAAIGRVFRAIIRTAINRKRGTLLISRLDLAADEEFLKLLRTRLGEKAQVAFDLARRAVRQLPVAERELGLALVSVAAAALLKNDFVQITELTEEFESEAATVLLEQMRGVAAKLAKVSGGAVRVFDDALELTANIQRIRDIAGFNAALELARRFEPTLTLVRDEDELDGSIARLEEAMVAAAESAHAAEIELDRFVRAEGGALSVAQQDALAAFKELAASGPAGVVELASEPTALRRALSVCAEFRVLANAARLAPGVSAIRRYLRETGLLDHSTEAEPSTPARGVTQVVAEAHLLYAEAEMRVLFAPVAVYESVMARFEKLRTTYAELYRAGHRAWSQSMAQLALRANDLRAYLEVLRRLDSIPALGEPAADRLSPEAGAVLQKVTICNAADELNLGAVPRCQECHYVLGTEPPEREFEQVFDRVRRAVEQKLWVLSRYAVHHLIREHAEEGKMLDGLLKMIQASQAVELVQVIDDKSVAFLGRLLEKLSLAEFEAGSNIPEAGPSSSGRSLFRSRRGHRAQVVGHRANKPALPHRFKPE